MSVCSSAQIHISSALLSPIGWDFLHFWVSKYHIIPWTHYTEVSAIGCRDRVTWQRHRRPFLAHSHLWEWIPGDAISRSTLVQVCLKVSSSLLIDVTADLCRGPGPGSVDDASRRCPQMGSSPGASHLLCREGAQPGLACYGDDVKAIIAGEESGDSLCCFDIPHVTANPGTADLRRPCSRV